MARDDLASGFRIGHVAVEGRLVLSPMAGVTDSAFRRVCREFGASLVFTELISSDGLIRRNRRTMEYLQFVASERPLGVQLFGSDPDVIRAALDVVAESGPDIVDLNCGCPVPKVVKRGAGSALMNDPPRLRAIVAALARNAAQPITVKIRSGWDAEHQNAPEVARMLEDAGAACVAVHGRTRSVGHGGQADWSMISAVKRAVSIPVIGNGGVYTAADARRMLEETGCDAVMVARGALGNPWIFEQATALLCGRDRPAEPTTEERARVLVRHFRYLCEIRPGDVAVREMRKHVGWYLTGQPNAARIRQEVMRIADPAALEERLATLPGALTLPPRTAGAAAV